MNAPTATPVPATASGALGFNQVLRFEVSLNGAFGHPLLEDPIDFDAAIAAYPKTDTRVDEVEGYIGGTPAGI